MSLIYNFHYHVYVGKLFPNTIRFGAERIEALDRMARKTFNNILSTCFTQEITLLYFNLFITIHWCYSLSNQGKYDDLYVISSVHPGMVIICALGQVTCIRQEKFEWNSN